MLSSSKAMKELTEEQQNLQKELESLQNEHAQRMEEFYVEQKDLEKKLEQVMKQKCTCDSNLEKDKEAEYAAQVRITQFVQCCPFNVEIEAVTFSIKEITFCQAHFIRLDFKIDNSVKYNFMPYHPRFFIFLTQIYFSQFWRLEVQVQGASLLGFW